MDGLSSHVPSQRRSSSRAALLLGIALTILCLGIGCGEYCLFCDEEVNASPEAVASADKTTPKACNTETVTLDGTESSDPDGDSLNHQWAFTGRPTGSGATIQNATKEQASFQPDKAGSYVIELTVEDGQGGSATDSVTVTASSGPVADAGDDQQVSLGETVTVDGSDSGNPEEECTTDSLSFSWSLTDPEGGESDLGTGVQAEFTAEMEGSYTATLTVERGSDSDSDDVVIQVGGATLESLQYGLYSFTVEEVNDGVFGGLLAALEGTTLDETVDIPSTDEVPVERTISLNLFGVASVDAKVDVDRENPGDNFYTLTGKASGTASAFGVQCQIAADCGGEMRPETTTTVGVTLTISNPLVTGDFLCFLANTQGTIAVTLDGTLVSP